MKKNTSSIPILPNSSTKDAEEALTANKQLRVSELRYRRLFESARDGILILNAKTAEIDDVNPYLMEILGYTREEFLKKKLWEIGSFKNTKLNKQVFTELQDTKYIRYDDLPLETKDGRQISVEFISNVYSCDEVDIIQCNIRDNSKRHISEIALKATTRALKILNDSNIALLTSPTEQILLDEYCRIAVQSGGYKMAWIFFTDTTSQNPILPMAHFDDTSLSSEVAPIVWKTKDLEQGPIGRACKTMSVQVCENIASDPSLTFWNKDSQKNGYRSMIVLPFLLSEKNKAFFTLFGTTTHSWSSPELDLLVELAADLEYGIRALRTTIEKAEHQEKLRLSLEQTIQVIAETIGQRDSYTAGHQRRVASISSRIAEKLRLSDNQILGLHLAATIHDLGKIGIPAEILVKPTKLSNTEYGLIQDHVNIGIKILKHIDFPWPIVDIIWQHHERLDGSGYPRGLKSKELLIESKILAVADVVEAMASHRPYRPALGIDAALQEITAHRNTKFDAHVVDACVQMFQKEGFSIVD